MLTKGACGPLLPPTPRAPASTIRRLSKRMYPEGYDSNCVFNLVACRGHTRSSSSTSKVGSVRPPAEAEGGLVSHSGALDLVLVQSYSNTNCRHLQDLVQQHLWDSCLYGLFFCALTHLHGRSCSACTCQSRDWCIPDHRSPCTCLLLLCLLESMEG